MRRRHSGLADCNHNMVVDDCWIISRTTAGIHCLIDSECSPDRLALQIGNTGKIFVVC